MTTDIVIIGAGPVGLFAVFQCGMLGMRCHVVDALPEIGGQCTALYPEKPIYDIPGFPQIDGADLIAALEKQRCMDSDDVCRNDSHRQGDHYRWWPGGFWADEAASGRC
jgi:thioredoxin reductase